MAVHCEVDLLMGLLSILEEGEAQGQGHYKPGITAPRARTNRSEVMNDENGGR